MIKKSITALLIILVLGIGLASLLDYDRVIKGYSPRFCFKEEVFEYDDGETTVCRGPGYNVFDYNRDNKREIVFVPFWTQIEE